MELHNKITIKRVIECYPFLAMSLLTESDEAIKEFADKCGLTTTFIRQNIKLIKQWI